MEKHGGSANSGQVGRRLSLQDKAVIMWALDTLADNSMAYVKEVRMVIERQTAPPPPVGELVMQLLGLLMLLGLARG